jgi:hypothetical protein
MASFKPPQPAVGWMLNVQKSCEETGSQTLTKLSSELVTVEVPYSIANQPMCIWTETEQVL